MHLLIDVRTSCLSDRVHLSYGILWATLWQEKHPHDRLTFLAYEDDPVDAEDVVFLARGWSPFSKKVAAHPYGPERIISFSKLPSIDCSIPMIRHICDTTESYYSPKEMGFFQTKIGEYQRTKSYTEARHLIVSAGSVAREITEMYHIDERRISIIPYLSAKRESLISSIIPMGITGGYYITECTPTDEWNPIELLRAYSHYIHDHGGREKLILLGDLGDNLGVISTLIRTLDIMDHVKIIGCLGEHDRKVLYHHAKGWIYLGHSYSRGGSIGLASGYGLALFLSDIGTLENYTATYIHPNHIDTLPSLLTRSTEISTIHPQPDNNLILDLYARLIAS